MLLQVWTWLCFHPPSIPGHRNGTHKTNSRNSREASTAQGSSPQRTPLCSGGFLSCLLFSSPIDSQAHRHYDQVICSLNSSSFTSLTLFWFWESLLSELLDYPYFLSFREYPDFLAVIFLPGRWMCFSGLNLEEFSMRDGGEGYGVGVGTRATEHQMVFSARWALPTGGTSHINIWKGSSGMYTIFRSPSDFGVLASASWASLHSSMNISDSIRQFPTLI